MGRLFWKFFFASWFTLVLAAVGAAAAVSLQWRAAGGPSRAAPHHVVLDLAATTLKLAGPEGLRDWLKAADANSRTRVYAVNAAGEDLLGRKLSAAQISTARESASAGHARDSARLVNTAGGAEYVLFNQGPPAVFTRRLPREAPEGLRMFFPWPWLHIIAGTVASVLVSALLAWYMARPIGNLRAAFNAVAGGALDTRVAPLMGRRRDEIADLGRDFDIMAERLQRLMIGQRRLLHDVSHELRSPLARLHAAVGLLRQDPRELEGSLGRIEREVGRLDALVGEVLTLARLDSGAIDGPARELNLSDLVADVVQDTKFEAESSGKDVVFADVDDVLITGRGQLLERAIENVLRNAVKYTAPATAVHVELRRHEARHRAVLTVSDSGPGIREEEIANMFQPFFRATAAADAPGFGLGLAIAKRAVDVHGGTIRAQNVKGGGLKVIIELPLGNQERYK
jgi:two-component system OmpR family sensor kinase